MNDGPATQSLRQQIDRYEADAIMLGHVKQLCLDERYKKMVEWAVVMRDKAIAEILSDPGNAANVARMAGRVDVLEEIIAQESALEAKMQNLKNKIERLRGRTREAETSDILGFGFEKGVAG